MRSGTEKSADHVRDALIRFGRPLAVWTGSVGVALGTAIGCLLGTAYFAQLMRTVVPGTWQRLLLPSGMPWRPALAALLAVGVALPVTLATLPSDRLGAGMSTVLVTSLACAAAALVVRSSRHDRGEGRPARPSHHPAAAA